jgi:hypothetical protein
MGKRAKQNRQLDLDVVLTDLMMPGADGVAVLKHVREVCRRPGNSDDRPRFSRDRHRGDPRWRSGYHAAAGLRRCLLKDKNLMSHASWQENQLLRREVSGHFAPDRR